MVERGSSPVAPVSRNATATAGHVVLSDSAPFELVLPTKTESQAALVVRYFETSGERADIAGLRDGV
jgi:hypothetical protein